MVANQGARLTPEGGAASPPKATTLRQFPSASAVGAAIIGGAAVGTVFGPIWTIVGFVAGAIAGELFERHAARQSSRATARPNA